MPHKENPAALGGANGAGFTDDHNASDIIRASTEGQRKRLAEALRLASLGLPVYPVSLNKVPACPHGFKDASTDPETIRWLFSSAPKALLIGVATGAVSGIDALDLDLPRHPEARAWFEQHRTLLPPTLVHETRSGGLHLIFEHSEHLRCSVGRPVVGVDVRADGGGVIWWPAAGYRVLSQNPPARWPEEILAQVRPARRDYAPPTALPEVSDAYILAALRRAQDAVANAPAGRRNQTLNTEIWSLLRFVVSGSLSVQDIAQPLADAAFAAGLSRHEIVSTLTSAIRARGL
jgi:hypothetical protein